MSMFRDLNWPADRVRRTLLQQVKTVTRQHIEAEYPVWKQQNINAASLAAGSPTAEFTAMKAFIDAKRERSNQVEAQIAALADADLYDFDVLQAIDA